MKDKKPINQLPTYTRRELPSENKEVFTGRLSSAGQIVVPSGIRNGEETIPDFAMQPGCLVEVQLIAVHYPEDK
jgi:hypothetical protein